MAFTSAPAFLMANRTVRTFTHHLVEEELPPRSARGDARERVRDLSTDDDIFTIVWEIQEEGRPWGIIFTVEGVPHDHDHQIIAVRFTCQILHDPLRDYGDWVLRNIVEMFEEAPIVARTNTPPIALPPPSNQKDEVERLRRAGKKNPEVAKILTLSIRTVGNYVTDINKRLRDEGLPPLP